MSAPHIIRVEMRPLGYDYGREYLKPIRSITVDGRAWGGSLGVQTALGKITEISLDDQRCWDETHLYIDNVLRAIDKGILHDLPLAMETP